MEDLTKRELEIIELVAEGLTDRAIGARLFIAAGTVKFHLTRVYMKLEAVRSTDLNARVTIARIYLEHVHDQHTRAIRAHYEEERCSTAP